VNGRYYAIQGECPRCAFDLWKGDLITKDSDVWEDLPRVACPTCATTYSMRTGTYGPPIKRTGLQGFVSGLAKSATSQDANKNAKSYVITVDEDGTIYCS
jgi:nitrite reductase/ring-hydroxylating ferredoxin subunit